MSNGLGYFVWHEYLTTDVERARAFYTELLGWRLQPWEGAPIPYHLLFAGEHCFGGMQDADPNLPTGWISAVAVADTDASAAAGVALGGTLLDGPKSIPSVGRVAALRDPWGACIELYCPEKGTPQKPPTQLPVGSPVWMELVTTHPDEAAGLYAKWLGWKVKRDEFAPEQTYVLFEPDETHCAGMVATPMPAGFTADWYPYFWVEDADASTAKARDLGAQVFMGPMDVPRVGRIYVLGDPLGAAFALIQPMMPSS